MYVLLEWILKSVYEPHEKESIIKQGKQQKEYHNTFTHGAVEWDRCSYDYSEHVWMKLWWNIKLNVGGPKSVQTIYSLASLYMCLYTCFKCIFNGEIYFLIQYFNLIFKSFLLKFLPCPSVTCKVEIKICRISWKNERLINSFKRLNTLKIFFNKLKQMFQLQKCIMSYFLKERHQRKTTSLSEECVY